MYRSLMFKSNPFAEELQRYNLTKQKDKKFKTLQPKNYSFFKINEEKKRNNLEKSIQRPRSILNQHETQNTGSALTSQQQRQQNKNFIHFRKSIPVKKESINPDIFPDRSSSRYSNQKTLNANKFNKTNGWGNHRKIIKVSPDTKKQQQTRRNFTRNGLSKVPQIRLDQSKQMKMSCSLQQSDDAYSSLSPSKDLKKSHILKSTLYQSIDLDNLFQKLQSKVITKGSVPNPQDAKIKGKIMDRLKRQMAHGNLSPKDPQGNLQQLFKKKQSLRDSGFGQFIQQKQKNPEFPMDMSIDMIQAPWASTRRRKTSRLIFAQDVMINEDLEKGNDQESDLKVSLKKIEKIKKQLNIG